MSLADDLQRAIDNKRADSPVRLQAFERAQDIVEFLGGDTKNLPASIALDMLIAFREPFHGGWMLWLGGEEVTQLSPEQQAGLSNLRFDEKAKPLFRLSLWTKNKRAYDAIDITDIPDGAEIYMERVTGAKLFVASQQSAKLAEGNASRVELVTKVADSDSEGDKTREPVASSSQGNEGTDSEGSLTKPLAIQKTPTTGYDTIDTPSRAKGKGKAQKKPKHE